jgi:hypothetical protein
MILLTRQVYLEGRLLEDVSQALIVFSFSCRVGD